MNLKQLDKNTKIFLALSLVLLVGIITFLIIDFRAEPVQEEVVQEQYPRVEIVEGRPFTPIEDKIVKTVLELKRSPVAHFMISIQGVVKGFYNRTIVVEAMGEQLKVPVLEGAVVVTEVWPPIEGGRVEALPAETAPPVLFAPPSPGQPRLEPFPLENISFDDIVRIQARIGPFGDLEAFEVIVTPIN